MASADDEFERLNAPLLRHFSELLTELGGCPDDIMQAAAISPNSIADDSKTLTYRQAIQLLEAAAQNLRCPDFGMRLAARQQGGSIFGPLGRAMRNSRTFGEALRFACERSDAHSRAARVWLWPCGGKIFAGHELLLENIPNRAQAIEQILLLGHLEAGIMTGGYVRARIVHFRHEPASPREVYRHNFGCQVRFGEATDGLTFWESDLACPIMAHSREDHRKALACIEQSYPQQPLPVHTQVRALIVRGLGVNATSAGDVARGMRFNARTLRRRLAEEGTSFQQIKDEVRRDLARYYLATTTLDMRTISEKLGFAEQSIFSRSCHHWFGHPPSVVRQCSRAC